MLTHTVTSVARDGECELTVELHWRAGGVSLQLIGALVRGTAHWVDEHVDMVLAARAAHLELDLRRLKTLDAIGLDTVSAAIHRASAAGCLVWVSPSNLNAALSVR